MKCKKEIFNFANFSTTIKAMIKDEIKKIVSKVAGSEVDISVPENENFGHYSTNVAMRIAKAKGGNPPAGGPMQIANEIINKLRITNYELFEKIEAVAPGFINFWISEKVLQKEFNLINKAGGKWGKTKTKSKGKKTVVIDYCGVNIAKPMSVGHLRSTIIGQALYNIFKFNGWKVIGDNHLGDWGKQFGILIAAYKENLKTKKLKNSKLTIDNLMELYVDYTARMKADVELENIAREETRKLQIGDKKNIKIWNEFHKITFNELQKIFKILNIKIDHHLGESFYNPMLDGIVKDALDKKVAVKSEGAVVIFIDNDKAPFLIQKSDGAFLYGTTDIATVKYRVKKFKPEVILYVVGNEQTFHLSQLFEAVKKLEIIKDQKLAHIKFGLVLGEDMKKLSTRAGKHISLGALLEEAIIRAEKIIEEKNPGLSAGEKKKIAKIVGIGAVKYNDLSQNRQSDIAFDWDKMLNFEGNSGPYIQYTYARLKSILRKSKSAKFDSKYLNEKIETSLILKLEEFPGVLEKITELYFTHYLAEYLFDLAKTTNVFYQTLPVLKAEKNERNARLALIKTVTETLKTGLNLLGIEVPEKM